MLPPEAKAPEPPPFRVVAWVAPNGATDAVMLCFPVAENHDKVRAIVERMSELSGWQVMGLRIEDDRFVSAWDQAEQKNPQGQLETFVEFSAAGVINPKERWLRLDPFIVALREYSPMRLAVAVDQQIRLDGPGNFEDNTVRIECNRQPTSIVYDITVKDPNLSSTGAPAHPPAPAAAPPQVARPSGMPWFAWAIIAVVAVAVPGAGLALWWKGWWPWTAKNSGAKPGADGPESSEQSG
jgi:hypothetical protein